MAPFPAALEDVRAALAFLVTRADRLNVDPARVALIGSSAGGHLSLLAAFSANGDPVNGEPVNGEPVNGEPVNGEPVNGNPDGGEPVEGEPGTGAAAEAGGGNPRPADDVPRVPVAAVVNLFGVTDMPAYYTDSRHSRTVLSLFLAGHLALRRGAYDAASPVRYVDPADPPVLTLHGTADPIVPVDQARRLHAALERRRRGE